MRRAGLRARLPALVVVAAVGFGSSVLFAPVHAHAAIAAGAVVSNGTVQLGINALGDLNYDCTGNQDPASCPGDSAAPNRPSGRVGLRLLPANLEGVADGSAAEGWGVADGDGSLSGYVNEDRGTANAALKSFIATGDGAVSVVDVANRRAAPTKSLRVTQAYAPSPASKYVYADTVTIENTGTEDIGDLRYRRTVDWDVEPTAFNEWVTAAGSTDPPLIFNSDDGFASSDPLAGPSYVDSDADSVCGSNYTGACSYTDLGSGGTYGDGVRQASDHGALYDFGFGTLVQGASRTFTVFYGAAPDETTATAALAAAGAQTYSLGESACTVDAVPDCSPTVPGGGGGGGGARAVAPAAVAPAADAPAADAPPDDPVGVTQGEPATFMLGFAASSADVGISQVDDPDPVDVGSTLTYDLTVSNDGPEQATGVRVEDALPSSVTLVSATPDQGSCTGDTPIVCQLGALSADARVHITITVLTPDGAGTIDNTATVSSATTDPDPDNNSSEEPTDVQAVPPVATDDAYSTDEDVPLTVAEPGVLANDTDPNGNTLFVVSGSISTPTSGGTVTPDPNGNGSFTYTPKAGFHGVDSFTYQASNGEQTSAPATVRITVNAVNHPPLAVADSYRTAEDTTLTVDAPGVLANDSDSDGNPLRAVLGTGPMHGALTLGDDGKVTYRPVANYNGPDSFTYRASDGTALSNPVTVSITVTPVADPVVAEPDSYTTARDTPLIVAAPGVLGNDTNVGVDGPTTAAALAPPTHGTLDFHTDGSFDYSPVDNYVGPDSFTYSAGGSSATVSITVTRGADRAPTAEDDDYVGTEDTPITADTRATGVLRNDTDPDGDTLTATLHSDVADGTLQFHGDGTFSYLPAANFFGTDSFTYTVSDGSLTSGPATVVLHVDPVDDPPVARPDDYSTPEDTTLVVTAPGILANDSDVDGDTLYPVLDTGPGHGTLTLGTDDDRGGFTYTPAAGFTGTDAFVYHVRSGERSSDPVTVTIHVTPVNHPPVAQPDGYSTPRDTTLTVPAPGVLGNDTDPDGNALGAIRTAGPAHGALTLGADGRVVYTPNSGFAGTDSFRYRASDGTLSSPSVRVTITVTAPATPPPSTPTPTTPQSTPTPSSPGPSPSSSPASDVPVPPSVPPSNPEPSSTPEPPPTTPPSSAPPSSTAPSSTPSAVRRTLRLTAPSVIPGGELRAAGTGCAPNSEVLLTIAGRSAGRGTAGADGHFDVPVTTTGLAVGTYAVTATCGERQQVADVALVYVTADSTAPTAQVLVVAVVLAFFLLLLGLVVRRPS